MDRAAAEDRHRLVDQLHAFLATSQRYQGKPLIGERLAFEVEVVEPACQLDSFGGLGGEGAYVGDRAADESQLGPTALNASSLFRQHGAPAGEPASGRGVVVQPLEIDTSDRGCGQRSAAVSPFTPESPICGLGRRDGRGGVVHPVFEPSRLALYGPVPLLLTP